MTLARWIRQITGWWEARRRRAQIYKAMPFMRELDRQEAEYRAAHKRGAARVEKAKRDAMTKALAGGTADWPKHRRERCPEFDQ